MEYAEYDVYSCDRIQYFIKTTESSFASQPLLIMNKSVAYGLWDLKWRMATRACFAIILFSISNKR